MKKVIVWIIALAVLAGTAAAAFHLGRTWETPDTAGTEENKVGQAEIKEPKVKDDGIVLFRIESFTMGDDSVLLSGKECGAFLTWTPDDDWITTRELPAEFAVPNDADIDYCPEWAEYATIEIAGSSAGRYFGDIYEKASVKAEYVYLHLQDGVVITIQQILEVCY